MVNVDTTSLEAQLRLAEEAENQVQKLESLASDAPRLRDELAKTKQRNERNLARGSATEKAKSEVKLAADKQRQVAHRLEAVSTLVQSLYSLFKEINEHRQEALKCLAISDQVDYEEDLEKTGKEEEEMGRDPKSIEFLVAARHGTSKVAQLIEELDPGFDFLRGCEVSDPMRRDVGNFILSHVLTTPQINMQNSSDQLDQKSEE